MGSGAGIDAMGSGGGVLPEVEQPDSQGDFGEREEPENREDGETFEEGFRSRGRSAGRSERGQARPMGQELSGAVSPDAVKSACRARSLGHKWPDRNSWTLPPRERNRKNCGVIDSLESMTCVRLGIAPG